MRLQECAPQGIDVVVDMVGGEPFREALKVAKWGAQILFIGFATGDIPKASLHLVPPGRVSLHCARCCQQDHLLENLGLATLPGGALQCAQEVQVHKRAGAVVHTLIG